MLTLTDILRDDLLPALLCAAVLAAGWRVWRRRVGPSAHWAMGLAAGGAFVVGYRFITAAWPHWPPMDSQSALLALAVVAGLVGVVDGLIRFPSWLRIEAALVVCLGGTWLLFAPLFGSDWKGDPAKGCLWVLGIGISNHALWSSTELLANRRHGAGMALHLTILAAATAGVVGMSDSLQYARLGGVVAAIAGAALVVGLVLPRFSIARGIGAVLVPLTALMFLAHLYAGLDLLNLLLLLVALPLTWLIELPRMRDSRPWLRVVLSTLILIAPLAVAGARAHAAFVKAQAEKYEEM